MCMHRTYEKLKNEIDKNPFPRKIRNRTLRKLLILHTYLNLIHDSKIKQVDLIKNPKKCTNFIMDRFKLKSERTAYDYYNTLLYIDTNSRRFYEGNLEFIIQSELEQSKHSDTSSEDTSQSSHRLHKKPRSQVR